MSTDTLIESPGQQPHFEPKMKGVGNKRDKYGDLVCPSCGLARVSNVKRRVRIYNTETKEVRVAKIRYWQCRACKAKFAMQNGTRGY